MLKGMNAYIQRNVSELSKRYVSASPFPHIYLDNFLEADHAESLLRDFPSFDRTKARDEAGRASLKYTNENLKTLSPSFSQLDALFSSEGFLHWLSLLTGIPNLLYDPHYIGGGTHENLPKQDLSPHIDFNIHPETGWYRRLNVLLYLNPIWKEGWGGELELHRDPWQPREKDEIVSILPQFNRIAVFSTSDISWHGFRAIQEQSGIENFSRKSVAAYFYTKEPPPHGLRFHHSTIYCERHLPEEIKPGRILTEKDYQEFLRLTARRDHLLQFLYERELGFSETTENLVRACKILEDRRVEELRIANERERVLGIKYQETLGKELAWERDYKNLMAAFSTKNSYFRQLLAEKYEKKIGEHLTLLPKTKSEFVVARGSCNRLGVFSGDAAIVKAVDPNLLQEGDFLLVKLQALLPYQAEANQFTIVRFLKFQKDFLIAYSDDVGGSLCVFPPEINYFKVAEKADSFSIAEVQASPVSVPFRAQVLLFLLWLILFFLPRDSFEHAPMALRGFRKAMAKIGLLLCFHFHSQDREKVFASN